MDTLVRFRGSVGLLQSCQCHQKTYFSVRDNFYLCSCLNIDRQMLRWFLFNSNNIYQRSCRCVIVSIWFAENVRKTEFIHNILCSIFRSAILYILCVQCIPRAVVALYIVVFCASYYPHGTDGAGI